MYIYICVCVCACVYVFIYVYMHGEFKVVFCANSAKTSEDAIYESFVIFYVTEDLVLCAKCFVL